MTIIKLVDGTLLNCEKVELMNGSLRIVTQEKTVEELAELFKDKNKTSRIVLLTESEIESGFKVGFTSFAGITYAEDGTKTVELFQPADTTEARISSAEGAAQAASDKADIVQSNLDDAVTELTMALTASMTATEDTTMEEEV